MPNPDGSPTAAELIAAALAGGSGDGRSRDHPPQLRQDGNGRWFWWDPDNPGNVQYVDGLPGRTNNEPQPTNDWQWTGTDGPHGRVYVQQMSNGRQRYMYADAIYDSVAEVSSLISSQGGPVDDNTGRPINDKPTQTRNGPMKQDPITGKWFVFDEDKRAWVPVEGGPQLEPDTRSSRSGGGPVSIGGGGGGGSRSTFTPDYNSSGAADQTAAWAHSDAQQKAQNDWQAAQNELNRAQDAYQFAQRMGLDTAKFKLDLQQAQITAAKAYAELVSTPDLNALDAFLAAGGGNVSNALAGGGTMLTDNAIRPGAMALQGIRDLRAINPWTGPAGGTQPIGGPTGSPPSTTAPPVNGAGPGAQTTTPAVTPTDRSKIPLGITQQIFGPDPADPTKQIQTGWRLSDGTVINNDATIAPNTPGTTSPGQTGSDWDAIVQRWINQPHQVGNSQITMAGYDPAHPPGGLRGMLKNTGFWGAPAQQLAGMAFDTSPENSAALRANNPWMEAMYRGWLPLAMSLPNANAEDWSQVPPEFRPRPAASLEDQLLTTAPKKTGKAPAAWEMGTSGSSAANPWDPTLAAAGGKNERAPGAIIPISGAEAGGGVDTPITNVPGRQPFPTAGDMGVPLVKDGIPITGPLPRFGDGGMMNGMGVVGERGKPELVIAPKGAMVIPMDRMQRMTGRVRRYGDGGTINPYDPNSGADLNAPAVTFPGGPGTLPMPAFTKNGALPPPSNGMAPPSPTPTAPGNPFEPRPAGLPAPPSVPGSAAGAGPWYGYPDGSAGHSPTNPLAPSVPGSAAGGGPMYGYPGGASHNQPDPFAAPSVPGTMEYQYGLAPGSQYRDPNNPGGVFATYPVATPGGQRPAQGGGTGASYPVPNIVPTSGPTGGQDPNLPFDNGGDPMDIVRNFRQNAKTLPGFNPYDVSFWNQPSALRQMGFKAIQTKYGVPVDVQEEEAQRMRLHGHGPFQGRGGFRYGY